MTLSPQADDFFRFDRVTPTMPLRNLMAILLTALISLACYTEASKNRFANLFAETMEVVNREALHPVPREKLFVSAMKGMLKDLDEHSIYISGEDFRAFDEELKQEFGGVGMYVEVDPKSRMLMVLAPMPGTPAFEAGLLPGDLIVSIDGNPTLGKDRPDAIKLLRGPVGETVSLEIQRGEAKFARSLARAHIPVESVQGDHRGPDGSWQFTLRDHPHLGYIRLIQFGERTAVETRAALQEIGSQVDGVILDIRSNSGGLLSVAVEICDMLLEPGLPIVRTRGRDQVLLEEYLSTPDRALAADIPVVVLIDRYSASASEILAGCLQDHGRAVLIGEQSYGKGTVQNIIPIQRNQSALKLTTASYWRPSGRNIDRNDESSQESGVWGVQPNPSFAIEMDVDELLQNLRQRNAREIEGLAAGSGAVLQQLRQRSINGESETPDARPQPDDGDTQDEPGSTPGEAGAPKPHVDRPLQRAVEYLQTLEPADAIAA